MGVYSGKFGDGIKYFCKFQAIALAITKEFSNQPNFFDYNAIAFVGRLV